jgi:hypothetical protein
MLEPDDAANARIRVRFESMQAHNRLRSRCSQGMSECIARIFLQAYVCIPAAS